MPPSLQSNAASGMLSGQTGSYNVTLPSSTYLEYLQAVLVVPLPLTCALTPLLHVGAPEQVSWSV
jgi:hypothetical protein